MILPPEPFAVRLELARAAVAAAEVEDYPDDHPFVDQVRAAQRETEAMTARMASVLREPHEATGPFAVDKQARVLAALMRCDYCPHIEARGIGPDLPTFAVLTAGWTGCEPCAAAALARVPPTGTPGRETLCDFCDADDGTGQFAPLFLQTGALVISGGACSACVAALS